MNASLAQAPGREDELGQIAQQLGANGSSVIVINGEAGSGKSYVTSRALEAAVATGWQVTPYRNGRGIRVGTATTAERLRDEVIRTLRLGAPTAADGGRPLEQLGRVLSRAASRQPVLVVLDPYLPSDELARGIQRHLLPTIRGSAAKVALVVVARRRLDRELKSDLEIEVQRPDADSVERTLRVAVQSLDPPVDDHELAAYLKAARTNPRLLASLATVLPLGGPRPGPVAPSTAELGG
jgi:hypothetical protein